MLTNDRMIVLRLRKCATTQVAKTVLYVVGGEYRKSLELGGTVPTSHGRLDIARNGRLVLGTIRDPWSWYVSLWAYGCAGRGGIYQTVTRSVSARSTLRAMVRTARRTRSVPAGALATLRRGRGDDVEWWREQYADVQNVEAFRAWLGRLLDPETAPRIDEQWAHGPAAGLVGLLSWRYLAIFAADAERLLHGPRFASVEELVEFDVEQNVCDEIVRTDRIPEMLPRVLERAGYELDDDQRTTLDEMVHTREVLNRTQHRPTAEYYDAASIALVAERDRLVIERHGYAVPA